MTYSTRGFFSTTVFSKLSRRFFALRCSTKGGIVVTRNERYGERINDQARSVSWRWKKKKERRKKESFRDLLRNGEKMNVEARQKDGKRSPVKRPGAPVSVDTALVEHNARPGRLSLTITVCYLVQLKHPLSLSSFFPQPLPLLRCFFVQRDAHGRARKVH